MIRIATIGTSGITASMLDALAKDVPDTSGTD